MCERITSHIKEIPLTVKARDGALSIVHEAGRACLGLSNAIIGDPHALMAAVITQAKNDLRPGHKTRLQNLDEYRGPRRGKKRVHDPECPRCFLEDMGIDVTEQPSYAL